MPVIGHGVEICTYATRPSNPALGTIIYQTDTDEYLKYANDNGTNRWMQADVKSNRNLLVNGNFNVWQRNTGFTVSSSIYTADRWNVTNYGGATTISVNRSNATPPTGFQYFMRLNPPSATQTNYFISQSLETANVIPLQGKYVTFSFWYRIPTNFSFAWNANLLWSTATDGNLQIPNSATSFGAATLPNTNSWTRFSLTAQVPSNATSLAVRIDTVNNTVSTAQFDITGAQLEVGTAPSEFETERLADTLNKCYRYYYPIKTSESNSPTVFRFNYGGGVYDNYYYGTFTLPVQPRITNGITFYDILAGNRIHKPYVRWDSYSELSYEALPGNGVNYQINIKPSTNDGASYYGAFIYGIGIIYNGEL